MTQTTNFSSGTTVTSDWLNEINDHVFNYFPTVMAQGAVADGDYSTGAGTDNTAVFQAAINALETGGGGVLYIPPGIYKLSSQITVPSGVSIIGAGMWSTILFCPAAFADNTGLVRINGTGGYPTKFSNLAVLAQTGGSGGIGLRISKNGVFVSDVWVGGFITNAGIYIENTDVFVSNFVSELNSVGIAITEGAVNISDGTLYGNQIGLEADNSASAEATTINISNVRANQCLLIGFDFADSKNLQISNCAASHPNNGQFATAGIYVNGGNNVSISNFVGNLGTTSSTATGISLNNVASVIINGANLFGWVDGIACTGTGSTSKVIISNVSSQLNGRYGISVSSGDAVNITGNVCNNNGLAGAGAGIYSNNTQAYGLHLISNNVCNQTGGGGQTYGINAALTDNGGISGYTNIVANLGRFNSTANINTSGLTANINQSGNY